MTKALLNVLVVFLSNQLIHQYIKLAICHVHSLSCWLLNLQFAMFIPSFWHHLYRSSWINEQQINELQETLLRVCCAMLIIVRKRLLAGDFTSNLKLLQNYPSTNISHLLYVANKLRVLWSCVRFSDISSNILHVLL